MFFGFMVWLGLLYGCDGNSSSHSSAPDIVLVDLLPASTRGLVQLVHPAGAADTGWEELLDDEGAPWRHSPADILRYYSGGTELVTTADQLVLAQPTNSGDEYVLLVDIGKDEGEAVFDAAVLVGAGQYRGFPLQAMAGTELLLARLNDRTWVIAPSASMEQVIDVHLGTLPNIHTSDIANYLDSLDEAQPITFVYGLPALYKSVVPPGSGANSLSQATVARGAFSVQDDTLDGYLQFVSANAVGYTQRLVDLLSETHSAAIEADGDRITIDLTGLSVSGDSRPLLKSLLIGMDAIDYSEAVIHGGNAPWMNYRVDENPNSQFIIFEFRNLAQREAFEVKHLPAGFAVAPIRIFTTDEPRYLLVLNFYQSPPGLVEGAHAEWSVFVHDPDGGEPRFLVIEVATEGVWLDSVNLLTPPVPVSHELSSEAIKSYVGVVDKTTGEETTYFSSSILWPQVPQRLASLDREFATANDHVFWGNGVSDRGLHNAGAHNRKVALVEADEINLVDNSRWSQYIKAEPVHALVYLTPLEFAITPWWNLDADYLAVTEDYRQQLIDFKNSFYPQQSVKWAEEAMRGQRPTLNAFTTGESVPTTRFHFVITDPQGLFSNLGIGDEFTPVAIALYEGELPDYYLSLEISSREGDPCGVRAQWVTYVASEQGRPETLQLDAFASDACLDPVSLLGLPAVVEQDADGMSLQTRLMSPFIRFDAQTDVTWGVDVLSGLDWIEAGDRICALSAVCDHFFYDGQVLGQPVIRVDSGSVVITDLSTPWDAYIQSRPYAVTVQQTPSTYAVNPWKNVPAL